MTENRLFVLGGPETQLHDILWAVHDGKNHGRSEGEENFGEFPVTVGGHGAERYAVWLRISLARTRVCLRRFLTAAERGVRLLNPSDRTASYVTEPERSIPWLLTEPERSIPWLLTEPKRFLRCCC